MNFNSSACDYEKSSKYWADVPPTLNGVLGGFGFISDIDLKGSECFLKSVFKLEKSFQYKHALDCGAGIGRITKSLLIHKFDKVDVVEPNETFLNSIADSLGPNFHKIGSLYKESLQEFYPENKYDIIWNQWVVGYLSDDDLVAFLLRCRDSLSENGIIIVKENVTSSGKAENDETDSSVTRTLKDFITLFERAKLYRIKQSKQKNFPNGIYPVYMFALVPDNRKRTLD